ncbi:MAG TPA: hypothetical protein VHP63_03015, partial [candidate division Zixibacteria bacterium]|nr:hypothetical protein [candidate division Zixibacteria bacterium]
MDHFESQEYMFNRVRNNTRFDKCQVLPRNGYFCENPWDGNENPDSKMKAAVASRTSYLRLALVFWTVLILLIVGFAGSLKAQKMTTKKTLKYSKSEITKNLDQEDVEAAEEYAYLLEQLLYLSSDYCRYFDKLDDKSSNENYRMLANLCAKISDKEKYENIHKLLAEIEILKVHLAEREDRLEELQDKLEDESLESKQAQINAKSLKLTASLREELESLDDQLKRDVVWRVDKNRADQEAIQTYVQEIIDDSLISYIKEIAEEYATRVRFVKDSKGKNTAVVVEVPGAPAPHAVYVPEVLEIPGAPAVHPTPNPSARGHYAGPHFYKELKDSIAVSSKDIQIYVTNAIGDLQVTSWANKRVNVNYTVVIAAGDYEEPKEFGDEIDLRIYPKQSKIYIESIVPPMADPKMRVLESRLEIQVPVDNVLYVSNSSGNIGVSDIARSVVVKGSNCNVDLNRIGGNVEISNSSGNINVVKVKGSVVVQNRMGPVNISNCSGSIEVDNSYGNIFVTNCDGNTVIRNTGAITVGDHIGNVEITNRSGIVDVFNLDGNLAAFNSFEPLRVKNITGTAKLVNANANVDATDIDGMASINNRFGQINTASIGGPLYIENKSGDITMLLGKSMSGPSTVVSNGGMI